MHMQIFSVLASLTVVAAHGSGAWLDAKHHSAASIYSGMRVGTTPIALECHAMP